MTFEALDALAKRFGEDFARFEGVSQVVACATCHGVLAPLRIQPGAAASPTDRALLELSRARADAIVTTGRILREEPDLDPQLSPAAARWRAQRCGRREPARWFVLTSGEHVPADHPIFGGALPVTIVAPESAATALERLAFTVRPQFALRPEPDVRTAIECARVSGALSISIEAGASVAASLYTAPIAIDEILLAVFSGAVSEADLAGRLPEVSGFEANGRVTAEFAVDEASGRWCFRRVRRR